MTEIKKEAGFGQCLKNVRGEPVLMKKCYVLRDMEYNKNDPKWIKLRMKNRYTQRKINYFGLCV